MEASYVRHKQRPPSSDAGSDATHAALLWSRASPTIVPCSETAVSNTIRTRSSTQVHVSEGREITHLLHVPRSGLSRSVAVVAEASYSAEPCGAGEATLSCTRTGRVDGVGSRGSWIVTQVPMPSALWTSTCP